VGSGAGERGVRAAVVVVARLALMVILGGLALAFDLSVPFLRTHPFAVLFAYSAVAAFLAARRRDGLVVAAAVALVAALAAALLPHFAGFWLEWVAYVGVSAALVAVAAAWRAERRELRAVLAVTETALAYRDPAALVDHALGRITAALGVDNTAILLLDAGGRELVVALAHGPEEALVGTMRVPMGQGVAGRIAATRAPLVVADAGTLRALDPVNPYLREQVRALAGVPLLVGDRLIGVLHVDSVTPRRFGPDDLRLLQLVGDRLALALDHARLAQAEREARAEAEARRTEAEAALRMRDDFLVAANHDLRTPLTAALGYATLIGQRLARETADLAWVAGQLAPLAHNIRRMGRVVEDISDAMATQAGRPLALHTEPVDLGALVAEVVAALPPMAGGRRIHLTPPAAPLSVTVERARLDRVVQNVLDNALKYSTGPVDVRVTVDDGAATVVVRDQGVGIPPADLSRVFERYYRASNAPTHAGGTGIGLATARAIMEQHGGTLAIASTVGEGTTVAVRLPLAAAPT